MTFLTTRLRLTKSPSGRDLERLDRVSTVYGIRGLRIDGKELVVDYDASRIHEAEVIGTVQSAGIGVAPKQPIPPGAFDYTGEFKDFAWPTRGLSPANEKAK